MVRPSSHAPGLPLICKVSANYSYMVETDLSTMFVGLLAAFLMELSEYQNLTAFAPQ